ncbi:MAG: tetratricopeptide repeat protein [Alphaproteobacteria bacterium]|nr:MAG: tetratricopeptide repeat protein [Alphaproteobacteria bacterium]
MSKSAKILLAARYAGNNGDWRSAENLYRQILNLDSENEDALNGLADSLYFQGRLQEAEIDYRAAVFSNPTNLNLRILLARYYLRLEYDQIALDVLEYILGQDPNHQQASLLICETLCRLGRIDEAHARARILLMQHGYDSKFYFYLAGTLRRTLEFNHLQQLERAGEADFTAADRRLRSRQLVHFLAGAEHDTGKERLKKLASSIWHRLDRHAVTSAPSKAPYRVGFVCHELRTHPVGRYFLSLLRAYAAQYMPDLRIHVYNVGDDLPRDPVYAEIRKIAGNHFRSLKNLPMDLVLETVRADHIDVLFDLGGHSPRSATWIFEARLAPVQIMWLGWGHTMGLPGIDSVLVDQYCAPTDRRFLAEECTVIDAPYMILPDVPTLPDKFIPPIVQNGFVTFGQPNRLDKWTPDMIVRDAAIMRELADSKMLVFHPDVAAESVRKNVRSLFAAQGIDNSRIEFIANTPTNYVDCLRRVDIVMDPIMVNGGATSMDVLAQGIPLFTVPGDQLFQRFSYAFLQYANLPQFCAKNQKDLIQKVIQFAGNADLLTEWRGGGITHTVAGSPLCDFAAYGAAWNRLIPQLVDRGHTQKLQKRM